MAERESSLEEVVERTGFLRCQIEVTEFLLRSEKQLYELAKSHRMNLEKETDLKKRHEIEEKIKMMKAEAQALRALWFHVSSLSSQPSPATEPDSKQ